MSNYVSGRIGSMIQGSLLLLIFIIYFVMPPLIRAFTDKRTIIIIIASLVFIFYSVLRYYLLLQFFSDKRIAMYRFLLDNGTLFIGVVLLIVFEGFVYVKSSGYSIPSFRFLAYLLSCSFLASSLYTNFLVLKNTK